MSEIWYVKRVRLVAGFEDGKGKMRRQAGGKEKGTSALVASHLILPTT